MNHILKFGKWTIYCIAVLIGFICTYLIVAHVLSKISTDKEPETSNEVSIYILTNGVHTDLVLPIKSELKDWSKDILFKNTISNDTTAKWIALGWGDKGFYLHTPTWDDLTFGTAFRAAFGLSTTAIHATFYLQMSESASCRKIEISKEQYKRLITYIQNSFQLAKNGAFIHIKTNANYGKNDAFYEAIGSYTLFQTCNTWANDGLKSCGQKACLWTPFDTSIFQLYNQPK
jgi:uncharacterized protein (TIGR02117 family)